MLKLLAGDVEVAHVHQHQMVVRSAGNKAEALFDKPLGQCLGVFHHLLLIFLKLRTQRLAKTHGLCRDDVFQRAALCAREHSRVDFLVYVLVVAQDQAAPGTPQGLVGGGGNHIGIGHGRGMLPCCDQTCNVGHVHHQIRARRVGRLTELLEVNGPGIGGGARHNQLWLVLFGQLDERVIVDLLRLLVQAVGNDVKIFSGNVHGAAMAQVSAMSQIHAHHGVARLDQREKRGQIGVGPRVGLNVGIIAAKQLTSTLAGNLLRHVHGVAAAVIPVSGISFGVFIGQAGTHRRHDRLADHVFAGNQLNVPALTGELFLNRSTHLGIILRNKIHRLVHHLNVSFIIVYLSTCVRQHIFYTACHNIRPFYILA